MQTVTDFHLKQSVVQLLFVTLLPTKVCHSSVYTTTLQGDQKVTVHLMILHYRVIKKSLCTWWFYTTGWTRSLCAPDDSTLQGDQKVSMHLMILHYRVIKESLCIWWFYNTGWSKRLCALDDSTLQGDQKVSVHLMILHYRVIKKSLCTWWFYTTE